MMTKDVSVQLSAVLKRIGVKIITGAKIKNIDADKNVYYETEKGEACVKGDVVITAIGRKPVLENIGLETTSVK